MTFQKHAGMVEDSNPSTGLSLGLRMFVGIVIGYNGIYCNHQQWGLGLDGDGVMGMGIFQSC